MNDKNIWLVAPKVDSDFPLVLLEITAGGLFVAQSTVTDRVTVIDPRYTSCYLYDSFTQATKRIGIAKKKAAAGVDIDADLDQ